MRIARLALSPAPAYARLDGKKALIYDRAPWHGGAPTGDSVDLETGDFQAGKLLAPIEPTKIVAIGRNYRAHAKELGNEVPSEPLIFLKPPSAIVKTGGVIVRPRASNRVEHEAELCVVIGERAHRVPLARAMDHVFGYTVMCDVTARDLQKKDVQFTRAKGFDTFAPVGPWIETDLDPSNVAVIARVNGAVRQQGRTRDMIFDVAALVAYVSAVMTLEPGDVISTGTPEGVGPLVSGDVLEVEIEGIGTISCPVEDEA